MTQEMKQDTSHTAKNFYDQALACADRQEYAAAMAFLEQSINVEKTAPAWHDLGVLHYMQRQPNEAVAALQAALALDPFYHKAHANLARMMMETGDRNKAMEYSCMAVQTGPAVADYKQDFCIIIQDAGFQMFYPFIKEAITLCLAEDNLNHTKLITPWFTLFKLDPALKSFSTLMAANYKKFSRKFPDVLKTGCLNDLFLIRGLQRTTIADPEFERVLTFTRRWLLENADQIQPLGLITALAEYCSFTDYVFNLEPHEHTASQILRQRAESGDITSYELALLACYLPLYTLANAAELAKAHENIVDLIRIQIKEPLREQEIRKTIQSLTPIDSNLSQAVRSFYEEFPYPKWKSFDPHVLSDAPNNMNIPRNAKILIAGCGTGREAMMCARMYPDADILAVDLSLSSLAYAIRKTEELGARNVTFRHGDFHKMNGFDKHFDIIFCSGVLVCVEDPKFGWSILTRMLKDTGMMRIGLYSELARQSVVEARRIIEKEKISADPEGIRFFRGNREKLISKKTLQSYLTWGDYYVLSECKDLLFHFQEHRFTLPQIEGYMQDLGLRFHKFAFPNTESKSYAHEYPEDIHMNNLKNWNTYEHRYPNTFRGMYQFWCSKENQAVAGTP